MKYLDFTVDMDGARSLMKNKSREELLPQIWEHHPYWSPTAIEAAHKEGDRYRVNHILEELGRCMAHWMFKEMHWFNYSGNLNGQSLQWNEITHIYHPLAMELIQDWWIDWSTHNL